MSQSRYQNLSRFALPPNFRGRSAAVVQLWWIIQATLFRASPQFLFGWRRWLLRLFGAEIGRGVKLRPSVQVVFPWKLAIGDNSWIGDDVSLYCLAPITIGAHSVVSQRCYLSAGSHDMTSEAFDMIAKPIRIGAQCWIATDVFVAPGVSIGDGTVVGARSTVFHDLPSGMVCYGTPAKPVRPRTRGDDPATAEPRDRAAMPAGPDTL